MTDPSGATVQGEAIDSITDRPVGLKFYVGLYTVGWLVTLLLIIWGGLLFWLFIPIPIAGLYLVYKLWNLEYWAWAITVFLHIASFSIRIGEFLLGNMDIIRFSGESAASLIFITYLYMIRGYFRQ
jgi:hypothetical protein